VILLKQLIELAITVMMLAILASVVLSWLRVFRVRIPYWHPAIRMIDETADLMLRPIRNAVPTTGGGFDFSPIVALLILSIVRTLVARL
jgi:uncharacterized protein YggT (Ycf19 family)